MLSNSTWDDLPSNQTNGSISCSWEMLIVGYWTAERVSLKKLVKVGIRQLNLQSQYCIIKIVVKQARNLFVFFVRKKDWDDEPKSQLGFLGERAGQRLNIWAVIVKVISNSMSTLSYNKNLIGPFCHKLLAFLVLVRLGFSSLICFSKRSYHQQLYGNPCKKSFLLPFKHGGLRHPTVESTGS